MTPLPYDTDCGENQFGVVIFGELSFFSELDKKIGVLPAASKCDVDVFTPKIEQNWPTGTRDMCQSMEGQEF